MEAVERRHRNAHEVDEVVSGKGEGERKGARKNDEGEDVGAKEDDRALEDDKPEGEDPDKDSLRILIHPENPLGLHEARASRALHDEEVEDCRKRHRAEDAARPAVHPFILEGEDEAQDVLNNEARHKGNDHGNKNAHDHGKGLAGVDVAAELGERRSAHPDLGAGDGKRASEKLEDDGNRGGGGQSQGIEGIEKEHVSHDDCAEDHHHFLEGEHFRHEDAGLRDLHHSGAEGGAEQHADTRHRKDHPEGSSAGTDSGIQKINGIV